jgi:hypothetical protein
VDAALTRNTAQFIDDLRSTIDKALVDPAEYHLHGRLRQDIERFCNKWELNFEWSSSQWVSGMYRGFRVGNPFPYDGDPTEPRIKRLGFYRAHIAAICNKEDQLNRLHTVDTLYAILDFIGLDEEAEPLYRQVLDLRKEVLGDRHPDTLALSSRDLLDTRVSEEAKEHELSKAKEICYEMDPHHTEEGLHDLLEMLACIDNTWDVRFLADLSGFCDLVVDGINTVLTVTESAQGAIANTATYYATWRWPKGGIRTLNWLSDISSTAQSPMPRMR